MSDNSKKEYIIKFKNSMAYLKSVKSKNCIYTFNIEEAKRYTKKETDNIKLEKEFEVFSYEEELYNSKEEKYKIYIEAIISNEIDFNKNDLLYFLDEYEYAVDGSGKFTAYTSLKQNYPNSKFINEILRVGEIVKNQEIVNWYEARVELSKDIEFNKKNNVVYDITVEDTMEYKRAKEFLKECKNKFPIDYDVIQQYEILDQKFKEKYITREIYKEYAEVFHNEDIDEMGL